MSEDAFYAPGRKASKAPAVTGRTPLRVLRGAHQDPLHCELRTFPHGVEAQIFSNDHGIVAQLFKGEQARAFAIEWLESERKAIEGTA